MAMSRILRALLISAVATGAAAAVLQALSTGKRTPKKPPGALVDVDELSPEERSLLMQEMTAEL